LLNGLAYVLLKKKLPNPAPYDVGGSQWKFIKNTLIQEWLASAHIAAGSLSLIIGNLEQNGLWYGATSAIPE